MNARRLAVVFLLLSAVFATRCNAPRKSASSNRPKNVPRVSAKILTIRTTTLPDKKSFQHVVAISPEDLVRVGDESDRWRLLDLRRRRVTFVDTVAKTYRGESLDSLIAARQKLVSTAPVENVPRVTFLPTPRVETIGGVESRQYQMTLGGYRRELWMSRASITPEPLFLMLLLSEPTSAEFAGVWRDALATIVELRGYPMRDRSEMKWDDKSYVIERNVASITKRDVPASWFVIPPDYRDLTPKPPPLKPALQKK